MSSIDFIQIRIKRLTPLAQKGDPHAQECIRVYMEILQKFRNVQTDEDDFLGRKSSSTDKGS